MVSLAQNGPLSLVQRIDRALSFRLATITLRRLARYGHPAPGVILPMQPSRETAADLASPRETDPDLLAKVLNVGAAEVGDIPGVSADDAAILSLARVVAQRLGGIEGNMAHAAFYANGFHLLRKHYYCAIPDEGDDTPGYWTTPSQMVGVDMRVEAQKDFIRNVIAKHREDFLAHYRIHDPAVHGDFFLLNGSYMAVDAHVYHALIREHRPRRILEIGTGYSTILAADVIRRMKEAGETAPHITALDPYPWDVFKNGVAKVDEVVAEKVQDVPLDRFLALEAGDFLFIDSTHVARANSDVLYEFLEILPRLKPGVWVHIHDISLPLPYPRVYFDTQTYWNEQWVLQAFLAHNSRFEVMWAGNYMMVHHPELMLEGFPEFKLMREKWTSSEPTAFWIRSK